jgi:tRNA U34 2-thiouridine synthase MnmA/TrmU
VGSLGKHVACAVSGGVDSAVAAFMLKKQGYKVTGCFMKNWDRQNEVEDVAVEPCKSDNDRMDAKYVCDELKIDFIEFDFSKQYWNNVFRCGQFC